MLCTRGCSSKNRSAISPFANSDYVKGHGDNRHIRSRDRTKKFVRIMFVPGYFIFIVKSKWMTISWRDVWWNFTVEYRIFKTIKEYIHPPESRFIRPCASDQACIAQTLRVCKESGKISENFNFAGTGDRSRDLSHSRQVSESLHYRDGLANPKNLITIYTRTNGESRLIRANFLSLQQWFFVHNLFILYVHYYIRKDKFKVTVFDLDSLGYRKECLLLFSEDKTLNISGFAWF